MGKVAATIKKEFLEVLPATIFFLFLFHIIALTRSLMLAQYHVTLTSTAGATILALVVAKVILIADRLPLINLFPDRPLIINALWRTFVYSVLALFVEYLEEFIPSFVNERDAIVAHQAVMTEMVWTKFWAIHIWLTVGILMYCTATELIGAIGANRVKELFFGTGRGSLEG